MYYVLGIGYCVFYIMGLVCCMCVLGGEHLMMNIVRRILYDGYWVLSIGIRCWVSVLCSGCVIMSNVWWVCYGMYCTHVIEYCMLCCWYLVVCLGYWVLCEWWWLVSID